MNNRPVKAVFLDRDGTLVKVYLGRPANTVDEIELLPGVPEGLRELHAQGLKLIVISNQGGIGLGYMEEETMKAMNVRLNDLLAVAKAPLIDAFYWCPHKPDDRCYCRKPNPGMLHTAETDLNISLPESYFIGDDPRDMDAAVRAGIKWPVMVVSDRYQDTPMAKLTFSNFQDAAHAIAIVEKARK